VLSYLRTPFQVQRLYDVMIVNGM